MPVSLIINDQLIEAVPGSRLYDYAEKLGLRVATSCKKSGKCKECIVEVTQGLHLLTPRTEQEQHLKEKFRLSCQCGLAGEAGEVRCQTMRRGEMRVERRGLVMPTTGEPMPFDPAVTRDGDRILIDGVEVAQSTGPIHGVAIDLGTTTVVLRLINLETGDLVADTAFENPQRFGGPDVLSRIQYDAEHRGLLMLTVSGYITHAIEEMPVDPRTIFEMVVVGGTAMRDLFFRQSVQSLGRKPGQSITEIEMVEGKRTTTALVSTGRRCLLPIHPKARVYGGPIIGGHMGADVVAIILANDLAYEDQPVAVMDIGARTDVIPGNAAIEGACMALLSRAKRQELEAIARKARPG